jgi:molybdate transport system substrate-binding protein
VAQYPLGILAESSQKDAATEFILYVTGPEGSAVLEEYGFDPVPATK